MLAKYIPDEDRVCRTCAHWDCDTTNKMGIAKCMEFGICGQFSIEPDAGHGALVLLSPQSHCRAHGEEWAPSSDYLDDLANNSNAGIDYPVTMSKPAPAMVTL